MFGSASRIWALVRLLVVVVLLAAPSSAFASVSYTCASQGSPFGSGFSGCTDGPFDLSWITSNGGGIPLPTPALNTSNTYTIDFDVTGSNYPLYIYFSPSYPTPISISSDGHYSETVSGADGLQIQVGNTNFTGNLTNLKICGADMGDCEAPPATATSTMGTSSPEEVNAVTWLLFINIVLFAGAIILTLWILKLLA